MTLFIVIVWALSIFAALFAGYKWGGKAKEKVKEAVDKV